MFLAGQFFLYVNEARQRRVPTVGTHRAQSVTASIGQLSEATFNTGMLLAGVAYVADAFRTSVLSGELSRDPRNVNGELTLLAVGGLLVFGLQSYLHIQHNLGDLSNAWSRLKAAVMPVQAQTPRVFEYVGSLEDHSEDQYSWSRE